MAHEANGMGGGYSEVFRPYIAAGEDLGYEADEVVAAMQPERTPDDYGIITIDGVDYESWRMHTPTVIGQPAKGGIRYDSDVTEAEVEMLTVTMKGKNHLHGLPFAGGKGGVAVSPDTLDADQMRELDRQHAMLHGYNPLTNVGATDVGTTSRNIANMISAIAEKHPDYKELANACFTGAPAEYGGLPEFRGPATGMGAALVLDEYIRQRAETDPALQRVLESGGKLSVITQGHGKAGRPLNENLPAYAGLKAVAERHGAIRARHGYLDPAEVNELVAHSFLGPETPLPNHIEWIDAEEFWKTPAEIVAPAARDDQVTGDVVRGLRGAIAVLGVANKPNTAEAVSLLAEQGIDDIVDKLANGGGVAGSYWEWARMIETYGDRKVGWDPEAYARSWEQRLRSAARAVFRATVLARREAGNFVTIEYVADRIVIEKAVEEHRQRGLAA